MPAGAPVGNTNATKGFEWRDAIRYELAKIGREIDGDDPAYKKGLRNCAQQFIKAANEGEMWALRELGDRTDGKSTQSVELSGPEGGRIEVTSYNIQPIAILDATDTQGK
jgi:hypothetical protein